MTICRVTRDEVQLIQLGKQIIALKKENFHLKSVIVTMFKKLANFLEFTFAHTNFIEEYKTIVDMIIAERLFNNKLNNGGEIMEPTQSWS